MIAESDVINSSAGSAKSLIPVKLNGRTIRIAHYVNARELINKCLEVCDIKLFEIPVWFDGGHFHNLMEKFTCDATLHTTKLKSIDNNNNNNNNPGTMETA